MKKMLYCILGCVSVGLGAAGTVLPVLPTVPFLMLGAFCFARSSKKLENWFKNTKLYKNNLADFAAGRGDDKENEMQDYGCSHFADEHWLYIDGSKRDRCWLYCFGLCVGFSSGVFSFWS